MSDTTDCNRMHQLVYPQFDLSVDTGHGELGDETTLTREGIDNFARMRANTMPPQHPKFKRLKVV